MKVIKTKHIITWVLIVILISIGTGCQKNNPLEIEAAKSSLSITCVKFNEAVESDNPTTEVVDLFETCSDKMEEHLLGKYLLRYEDLMKKEKASYSKKLFDRGNHEELYKVFPESFEVSGIDTISMPQLRSTLRDLVRSGYTLIKSENGLYEVEIDYGFFLKYAENIEAVIGAYFELMYLEQIDPVFSSDKKLIIGVEELKDRLLVMDEYIVNNPKSPRLRHISEKANRYLLTLVYGYNGVNNPYDDNDRIKDAYYDVYGSFSNIKEKTPVMELFSGLKSVLDEHDKTWSGEVYSYIIEFPEVYRKRYLNAHVYPEAFVDVGFGWTVEGDLYYYPVFTGIPDRSEQGKLNLLGRNISEKRMLGEGFDGMYTGGNYIWTDYKLTFNRRNWISLKYNIYTEMPDETYYWSIESLNYDLHSKRRIQLRDVFEMKEERAVIDESVKAFFEESRTYYEVSLEEFYKNTNPDFYLTNSSVVMLVPVSKKSESTERIVEIFIPFEKFNTSVEYIYKIPELDDEQCTCCNGS